MTRATALSPETLTYLTKARIVPAAAVIAVEFAACLSKWATRRQTRRALRQLEDWQLSDVGLTPRQAQSEASKAFWKP